MLCVEFNQRVYISFSLPYPPDHCISLSFSFSFSSLLFLSFSFSFSYPYSLPSIYFLTSTQARIVDRKLTMTKPSRQLMPRTSSPRCSVPMAAVVEDEEVPLEVDEVVVMPVGCESLTSGSSDEFLVS
jgi:hypothetical protein